MPVAYGAANPGDIQPWPIETTLANKAADNPAEAQAMLYQYQTGRDTATNLYEQQLAQQQQFARQQLVASMTNDYMQRATELAKTPGGAEALKNGIFPQLLNVLHSNPDALTGYAQAGNTADAATNLKNVGEGTGALANAGIQLRADQLPGVPTIGSNTGPITPIGVATIHADAQTTEARLRLLAEMNPKQTLQIRTQQGLRTITSATLQSPEAFNEWMRTNGVPIIDPNQTSLGGDGSGSKSAPSVITDTDTSAQGGGGNPLLKPGANPDNLLPPGGVIKQGTQVLPATTPTAADRSPAGAARAGQTSLPPAPAAAQKPAAATTTNAIAGKEKLQNVVLANLDTYRQRMAPADYKDLMDGMARNGGKPIVEPNPTTGKLEVRGASGKRL